MFKKNYVAQAKDALDQEKLGKAEDLLEKGMIHYNKVICNALGKIPSADIPMVIINLRTIATALEDELETVNPGAEQLTRWLDKNISHSCDVRTSK